MIMNKETDRRIRKKMFAKLLDDICKAYNYYIFTKHRYNPITFNGRYTISAMNRTRFSTASIFFDIYDDHVSVSGSDYVIMPNCGGIYYAVDEWDYIRVLYACALSCQDEAVINDVETMSNNFGIEMYTDDILADIDSMIERYTSPKRADGELVAWLIEFKKGRFGFRNEEELL